MSNSLIFLCRALFSRSASELYRWPDLLAAMEEIISGPFLDETKLFLVDVLHFSGRICLDPNSELPHSMSAEDMVKSLAMQCLEKFTGPVYLRDFVRIQSTTASPVLSGIARLVAQKAISRPIMPPIVPDGGFTYIPSQTVRSQDLPRVPAQAA